MLAKFYKDYKLSLRFGISLWPFYSTVESAMKLLHSTLLDVCFCMISVLSKVKSFSFWPKTVEGF